MASHGRRRPAPTRPRDVRLTGDFRRWMSTLAPEQRTAVKSTMALVAAGGPTRGRPHVDRIHGSSLHKLKEIRVDRSIRILFAFDSNRDAVMLIGGDKAGRWNRWYPLQIKRAEALYAQHERSIGKEPRCLSQREAGRTSSQRSR